MKMMVYLIKIDKFVAMKKEIKKNKNINDNKKNNDNDIIIEDNDKIILKKN
jgi:hypothetical protein